MFFSGKTASAKPKGHIMIVDIGSGSVAAGVSDGTAVTFSIRERFDSPEKTEAKEIQVALGSALESVLTQASKKSRDLGLKIDEAQVFYSSPWQVAHTKSVTVSKNVEFEITQKMFDDIFAHEEKEEPAFAGLGLLSQDILGVKINGYETAKPFGHKVKDFEANISMSFAPKDLVASVDDSIHRSVGHVKTGHHSFDLSALLALRHASLIPRDALLLHIHHRVTDLLMVTKGFPGEIVSFPAGSSSIVDGIARFLHIEESIALSKVRMHVEGKLQDEDESMIKAALMKPVQEWLSPIDAFFLSLAKDNRFVPKKIFILADGELWHVCRDALAQSDFSKFAFAGEQFDIEKIETEGTDTNIYIEALYCDIF